jgi:hypothetical protein
MDGHGEIAASAAGDVDVFWIVGGNMLETLPRPLEAARPGAAAAAHPSGHRAVVVDAGRRRRRRCCPAAATRYESPGGGTETSTERRIIFSPEIPAGASDPAKPEWWVFREVMRRARPERREVGLADAAAIRARSTRPCRCTRASSGWRGRATRCSGAAALFADGRFATADGLARFARWPARAAARARHVRCSRPGRGKQFNSMVPA